MRVRRHERGGEPGGSDSRELRGASTSATCTGPQNSQTPSPGMTGGWRHQFELKRQIVKTLAEKILIVKYKRLRALFHLNVIRRPQAAELTETSFRARNLYPYIRCEPSST